MGYTTDFDGEFEVSPTLLPKHKFYLTRFSETRRMKRDVEKLTKITNSNSNHAKVGLPLGVEGEFFVDGSGDSVIDGNKPPSNQPGLWCQWIPTEDGTVIKWDEGEKFYYYVEWIEYMIDNFFKPWGYKLNGSISWNGEDSEDLGLIKVTNNVVEVKRGRVIYE